MHWPGIPKLFPIWPAKPEEYSNPVIGGSFAVYCFSLVELVI